MKVDRWVLGIDPGVKTGGACLLPPATQGEGWSHLVGWHTHAKRGLEVYTDDRDTPVRLDAAHEIGEVIATLIDAAELRTRGLVLAVEEPTGGRGATTWILDVHRSIGHIEAHIVTAATLVPHRTWLKHHGMTPALGKAEIRRTVLELAADPLAVADKWPAAVREAAGEAFLIAHCARGTTP